MGTSDLYFKKCRPTEESPIFPVKKISSLTRLLFLLIIFFEYPIEHIVKEEIVDELVSPPIIENLNLLCSCFNDFKISLIFFLLKFFLNLKMI